MQEKNYIDEEWNKNQYRIAKFSKAGFILRRYLCDD